MKSFNIKKYHSVTSAASSSNVIHSRLTVASGILSLEEQNALRFIAGYMYQERSKRIFKSLLTLRKKELMATCIKEMIGARAVRL